MKIRNMEKEVYNVVNEQKFITPYTLRTQFGKGNYALSGLFIPNSIVAIGMSKELADAINVLRKKADIYEIACGKHFYTLIGGCEIGDMPIIKFDREKVAYTIVEPIEGKEQWLPTIYCNSEGVIWILKTLVDNDTSGDSRATKAYNNIVDIINGTNAQKFHSMITLSSLLNGIFEDLWELKVQDLEERLGVIIDEVGDDLDGHLRKLKKQLVKKHKLNK